MAKVVKSRDIEERIADLQRQLEAAKQAESEAADQELLRLVRKAGIRDEIIATARRKWCGHTRWDPAFLPAAST